MCHIIEHLFSLLDFAYTVELRGINHPIFAEEKVSFSTGLYCIFFHGLLGIHRLAERKKFPKCTKARSYFKIILWAKKGSFGPVYRCEKLHVATAMLRFHASSGTKMANFLSPKTILR